MDISVEVNLNEQVIQREVYNILDVLSDIGGMQGLLLSGAGYLIAICNYHMFDNFMVTRLYKLEKPKDKILPEMRYF